MSEELKALKKQLLKDDRNGYDVLSAADLEKIGILHRLQGVPGRRQDGAPQRPRRHRSGGEAWLRGVQARHVPVRR